VIDEYGFERLDLNVEGLRHEFDVRWKLLPATPGPPGYPAEPYIPLAVSFAMTSGDRRRQGHLLNIVWSEGQRCRPMPSPPESFSSRHRSHRQVLALAHHGPLTVVEVWDPHLSADKAWRVSAKSTDRETLLIDPRPR